jgi:hypothetical protein
MLIFLPFGVFTFLSSARRNVTGLPNFISLVDVDVTQPGNLPSELTPERCRVIDAAICFQDRVCGITHNWKSTSWPVGEGAVCYEMEDKFTTGEAARAGIIDPDPADPRPIRPLLICRIGTISIFDVIECAKSLLGGSAENFFAFRDFVTEVRTEIRQKNAQQAGFRYVPVLVGHSMGGALASAVAIQMGLSSLTFNPMGWGSEYYKMTNVDVLRRANTVDAWYHINLSVEGCNVSDPKTFNFQLVPGATLHLPNCTKLTDPMSIHVRIVETWEAFREKANLPD